MRTEVVNAIKNLGLTGYKISNELPYDESGVELFVKNPKSIYVDRERIDISPILTTLDAQDISNEATSVTAYFAIDAKQIPANYDSTLTSLRSVKNAITRAGANSRETIVSSRYEGDLLIVELEYRLTRVI